jgi:hypothetical protein
MGSRCHYPFSDRGGVRAHLLSPERAGSHNTARRAVDSSMAGSHHESRFVGGLWPGDIKEEAHDETKRPPWLPLEVGERLLGAPVLRIERGP